MLGQYIQIQPCIVFVLDLGARLLPTAGSAFSDLDKIQQCLLAERVGGVVAIG